MLFVPTNDGKKTLRVIPQTSTAAERLNNLEQCVSLLQLTMPALIDSDDNVVNRAYAAWPDRLYTIGLDGKIAYKAAPGPFGFLNGRPGGLAQEAREVRRRICG